MSTRAMTLTLSAFAVALTGVEVAVVAATARQISWIEWLVVIVVVLILALAVAAFSKVIVRVLDEATGRSLEVLYGPGGIVRQRFAPEDIEAVGELQLSALRMGGWGYRGSLRFAKSAAVITRSGDALMVMLSGGRRFVVTVDEPATFVEGLAKPALPSS